MAYSLDTKMKVLLKDPEACEVLDRHIPGMSTNPQMKLASGMTLNKISKFPQAKDKMTPEIMEAINKDLRALGSAGKTAEVPKDKSSKIGNEESTKTEVQRVSVDKLKGKVAIITGATSGMGRDTAVIFAEEGAKVMITGRDEKRALEVVEEIKKKGGEAAYVIADIADRNAPDKIVDEAVAKYGTVDILFNNAGVFLYNRAVETEIEDWDKVMQVNVTSAYLLSKKVAPIMKAKGKGVIINTSSIASVSSRYGGAAYCASKHALNGLTLSLARELAPEIRVNSILPGIILTPILDPVGGVDAVEGLIELIPLSRIGQGSEIGTVALFFASDDSSYVTGQLLRVNGGLDC